MRIAATAFAGLAAFVAVSGCLSKPSLNGDRDDAGTVDAPIDAAMPITANVIFVSSIAKAPGQLGGAAGADALCTELAAHLRADIPANTYIAWLPESPSVTAPMRVQGYNARGWVRPDGLPVADTLDELRLGNHYYPPRLDEYGADVAALVPDVVTATTRTGGVPSGNTCGGFQVSTGDVGFGVADGSGRAWTEVAMGGCSAEMRIYCLGVGNSVAVTAPAPPPHRRVFVSTTRVNSVSGTGYDAICDNDATANGFPDAEYLAALPYGSDHIASRFPSGLPWARKDGVVVLTSGMTEMLAPVSYDANGLRQVPDSILTGATSFVTPSSNTCMDYSSMASPDVNVGWSERSVPAFALHDETTACDFVPNLRVYCFEK